MGYLKCEKCNGYYELQKEEFPEDFERCQCGGMLNYFKNFSKLLSKTHEEIMPSNESIDIQNNENLNHEDELKSENRIFRFNGTSNPIKTNFNTERSESLEEAPNNPLKCSKCGNINSIDSNFCFNCGKNLLSSDEEIKSPYQFKKNDNIEIKKFNDNKPIPDVQITYNSISTMSNGNKLVYRKNKIKNVISDYSIGHLNFDYGKKQITIQFLNRYYLKMAEEALRDFNYSFLRNM